LGIGRNFFGERMMKWIWAVAITVMVTGSAFGDDFTDCMDRAMAMYKKGNFIAAQKELARASAIVEPKATAQIPPATVKDGTYYNYEQGFKISAVAKDWHIQPLVQKKTMDAVTTLATIAHEGKEQDEVAIVYVKNLKEAAGLRFAGVAGHETEMMKKIAERTDSFVLNLTECSKGTDTEMKVAGKPALATEFTAKKGETAMRCRVVQVMVGEKLFTNIFMSPGADWSKRSKDFDNMVGTMGFELAMPEPVLTPPGKGK
jgi:hypothetical protein